MQVAARNVSGSSTMYELYVWVRCFTFEFESTSLGFPRSIHYRSAFRATVHLQYIPQLANIALSSHINDYSVFMVDE